MGDVALLAPVLDAFSQRYPDTAITLVTRSKFGVFFRQFPNVRVVGVDFDGPYRGAKGLLRLFDELRRLSPFDVLVDVHQNLRSSVLKSLFRLIGVPSVTIDKGRAEKRALTRKNSKIRRPLLHTIERYARTLDRAGFSLQPTQAFRFQSLDSAQDELAAFLNQYHILSDARWLGIAPFAQHVQKMWPFERFFPLLEQLYAGPPLTIFLFGGGNEEMAQLERLQQQFPKTVVVAGQLSLAAELALMQQLNGMLCMDSGNMHLAALSGVPTVSIWGATHSDAGFGPWGQGSKTIVAVPVDVLTCRPCSVFGNVPCWRGDLACLWDISVEAVVNSTQQMLTVR